MLQDLKIILEKDPIISTYSANDLIVSPKSVEQYYGTIAKTHMSLGDTQKYQKRLYDCLINNKTTFNGAVVGEYGFGKTSILIYLWDYCDRNNILAIPPYQWSKFQEHFQTIYYWIKYKLRKLDNAIVSHMENIFEKYKDSSIETKAKEWAEKHDMDYQKSFEVINSEFKTGKISLEFTPNDLLKYCEETTSFLQEHTDYNGLLVITDELQQTITDLNPIQVYDYLFNMVNPLCNKKGNYGFLWGFPEKTFADLNRERADIIDRLNSNKAFIRLNKLYDNKFPIYLWDSYSKIFKFDEYKDDIVDKNTLIAIGQICDGTRRDLGNGPRTVISAFNAMVDHYQTRKKRYEVLDFVNDCMDEEIMLGGNSEYIKKIQAVLNIDTIGKKFEKTIKIMAGFPDGIPYSAANEYGLANEIDLLIQESGGLGKVVIRTINLYALKSLRKISEDYEETIVEDEIRKFYSSFANDKSYRKIAHEIFNNILIEQLFKSASKVSFEDWKIEDSWEQYRNGYRCWLKGSFKAKYPQRKILLYTTVYDDNNNKEFVTADPNEDHFAFNFVLHNKEKTDIDFAIKLIDEKSFQIDLNLLYQEDSLGLGQINQIIPAEKQSPLFFLSLIHHLSNANIPKNEIPENEFIKSKLVENIIYNLFNEDLLGYVENTNIEINNEGLHVIKDLFNSACDEAFKDYSTIMTSRNWEKKIIAYKNVLAMDSEKINLLQKRGKEPLNISDNPKENKAEIAALFNQKSTSFEAWLVGLEDLLEYKFTAQESRFLFKVHPLENYILDQIEQRGEDRNIDGVLCKSLSVTANFYPRIQKQGYLIDEIQNIVEIGKARKFFNFDKEKLLIYQKPEDKYELRENLNQVFNKIKNQIKSLSCFNDFPIPIEKIDDISESIPLIENKEQADTYLFKLKQIESVCKHYCIKSLQNITGVEIVQDKLTLEQVNKDLKKLLDEKLKDGVLGIVGWVQQLEKIRINTENEIKLDQKTANILQDKLTKITPLSIPNNVHVIDLFLETLQKYNDCKREIHDQFILNFKRISANANNFTKWKSILKLAGDLETTLIKYKKFGFDEDYESQNENINNEIAFNLENNQKSTLENHENYRQTLLNLMAQLREKISGLKRDWENKKSYYENKIKIFTGNIPHSQVRWSDSPELSYQDLYDFVNQQINTFLSKLKLKINELIDDVTYTMEVLNHKKAIQNKKIDSELINARDLIDNLLKNNLLEEIKKKDEFEQHIEKFKELNSLYISLNKEHRRIIKPIKIDNENERKFYDLLEKNTALDLKKLIIDYQKKCNPDIDLAESREEVLNILKELFLKKQIGVLIKKGKN